MEKTIVPVIIFLLILASAISILSFNIIQQNLEQESLETHSYTTAICNSTNFCQDNIVKCNKDQVININPITGAAVQFSHDWQDPRNEQEINGFCG